MSRSFDLSDYITVQDRISRFWSEYPDGRIETELMSPQDNFQSCRYTAAVYTNRADLEPAATGWAFEHAGERGPNATSHEENCETSAIGRALANMGYATSQKDRPSREEMAKVNRHVTPDGEIVEQSRPASADPNLATDKQVGKIHGEAKKAGWTEEQLHEHIGVMYDVRSTKGLTKMPQASELIDYIMTGGTPMGHGFEEPETEPEYDPQADLSSDIEILYASDSMPEAEAKWKQISAKWRHDPIAMAELKDVKDAIKKALTPELVPA